MRTLCLGEAVVDLICRHPIGSLADADAFVPSPGGVIANVAAAAARHGADVSLAGGVGDDPWGAWLRDRLAAGGVDLRWFGLAPGRATAIAIVTLDERGEPTWMLYGNGLAAAVEALDEERLLEAVEATDAVVLTSNTLASKAGAALTMAARERALELGRPIIFDPNVRLHRWRGNPGRAGTMAGACVPGAFLVKCNQAEARLLTGETDPEAAAASLLAAGAQHVIVTRGVGGAILRSRAIRLDVRAQPAQVRSTVGAGDVFLGVVIAHLGLSDYYPSALAAALPEAAAAAAGACERWGALE